MASTHTVVARFDEPEEARELRRRDGAVRVLVRDERSGRIGDADAARQPSRPGGLARGLS